MRLSLGLLPDGAASASTYVDDPITTYAGDTDEEQEHNMCVTVAGLLALGYDLAFDKAQDSEQGTVTWTSAKLTVLHDLEAIKVEVKDDIITEVRDSVDKMRATSTIDVKELRTLAGQATCIASLLHVWRPFVAMIWAPLYCAKARCPWDSGKVWTAAVVIALNWMSVSCAVSVAR